VFGVTEEIKFNPMTEPFEKKDLLASGAVLTDTIADTFNDFVY